MIGPKPSGTVSFQEKVFDSLAAIVELLIGLRIVECVVDRLHRPGVVEGQADRAAFGWSPTGSRP